MSDIGKNRTINLTLPEFAFVEGAGHERPNLLKGRNVILHIRSASIMEVFDRDSVHLNGDTLRFEFTNKNQFGFDEPMVIALHYSATLDEELDRSMLISRVLKPAAKWYCDYCDWEDLNIESNDR